MKIVKVEEVTGMGMRPFISIIPETVEDGFTLGDKFLVDNDMGSSVFFHDKYQLVIGSVDPESLVKFLNENLFLDVLTAKQLHKLASCIFGLFPKETG